MNNSSENKAVDSNLLKRLYTFIKPYRKYVIFGFGLTLLAAYLGTVRPYLTKIAVDDYIANNDFEGLLWIIFLLG